MALERQFIEKKDFPMGSRGYDPEAVDAHLAALADEMGEYKRAARRRADTLASSASEQVRAIVEAAESSAAEIQSDAEREAREIREEAQSEAHAVREQASEQAREYLGKISESTDTMHGRLQAMEQELTSLMESLRVGADRLNSDLQLLEADLAGVSAATVPRSQFAPEAPPAPAAEAVPAPASGDETAATPLQDPDAPDGGAAGGEVPTAEHPFEDVTEETARLPQDTPAALGSHHSDDAEGARLIALNMALNGTPRDETARYLSENFQLPDAGGLLDEVYASVEG